MKEEQAKEQV